VHEDFNKFDQEERRKSPPFIWPFSMTTSFQDFNLFIKNFSLRIANALNERPHNNKRGWGKKGICSFALILIGGRHGHGHGQATWGELPIQVSLTWHLALGSQLKRCFIHSQFTCFYFVIQFMSQSILIIRYVYMDGPSPRLYPISMTTSTAVLRHSQQFSSSLFLYV
jgi:hypothetical protein